MADADRPRGVLTPADRRFLRGDVTLGSEQSRYDAHYRIRNRVRNAVLDHSLLFEHLPERDRQQVFDPEDDRLAEAVVDAVAFCYLGAASLDASPERLVAEGVRRGERRRRGPDAPALEVDLSVRDADEERIEHIAECLDAGAVHDLDEPDLRTLARLLAEQSDRPFAEVLED